MKLSQNAGRVAGVWYLVIIIVGPLRLLYIPAKLFVEGNADATADNILAHQWRFRFGSVGDLVCGVALIFLVLALYRLFKAVDQNLAVLTVILGGLLVTPISFLNTLTDAAALLLVRGTEYLSVFDQPQRNALAMVFLHLHGHVITASMFFAGLWLFPFGVLVYRSGFLPRFLGVWLIIAGFAYLILFLTGMLLPQYQAKVYNLSQAAFFGELAMMLWLVIKGAKPPAPNAA
jgi:Domain of unknown function (DUF4386)